MLIEIKNRYSGDVIFSHDCDDNSIKVAVEIAVSKSISLVGANLVGARLDGANLRSIHGDMKFIFSMQLDYWPVSFTKDVLQIGCQRHNHNEWLNFDDERISKMDLNALAWWKKWKDFIFKAIELSINQDNMK